MTHKPNGGSSEDALNAMQDSLVTMLAAKSNLGTDEMHELMNATTWLDAETCKAKGFATEVEYTDSHNKKRMRALTDVSDKWKEAAKITNSILKPVKKMKSVTNKLGLSEDANEASILTSILEIENKAKSDKDALEKKIKDAEDALKDLKDKYDALEAENKTAEETAKEEKAKNMVEGFAKIGRIKDEDETIKKWVNLAKVDFEGTKTMIEELPINVVANKIEIDATKVEKTPDTYMHQAMKEIRNKTEIK